MNLLSDNCIYTFDGSLEGFLSVVFRAYEEKREPRAIISRRSKAQLPMGEVVQVDTHPDQAVRVSKGIVERSDKRTLRLLHVAFLTESAQVNSLLWRYLKKLFSAPAGAYHRNLLDQEVYDLVQTARRVRKEVHRFHGFLRFQRTKDDMYAAAIDPDNDILRLLAPHFRARFPDREWVIYDTRRRYGIWFDKHCIREVEMEDEAFSPDSGRIRQSARAHDEDYYASLWQHYYDAINIIERKNHRQMRAFMPKRYWKYLPEKNKGS